MTRRRFLLLLTAAVLNLASREAEAGKASKKLAGRAWRRLFARDAARDAATKARPLTKPTKVWRYTSREEAENAAKRGLAKDKHMTAGVGRGRPPTAASAQRRYGLARDPQVRMTIELPARQPVRRNKVLGGAPGVGEITSPKPVPPGAIRRIVPLEE